MPEQKDVGQAVSPAKPFYRRRLPHWHPERTWLFLTWRLFGSLPRAKAQAAENESPGQTFARIDRQVDLCAYGPTWLRNKSIAAMVVETLLAGDNERSFYDLQAYVVMPNHLHVVLLPKVELPIITRWLKGSTARRANEILNRTGHRFWQEESYDHWIRNEKEFNNIVRYVEYNPVAAGLVECNCCWPWSSAARAGETACPTILR